MVAKNNSKKRAPEAELDGTAKRARDQETAGVAPLLNYALGLVSEIM